MAEKGYADAIETAWIKGTFGYFGLTQRELILLNGSTGSDARRAALLDKAYQAGLTL